MEAVGSWGVGWVYSSMAGMGPELSVSAKPQSRRSMMNSSMAWHSAMRKAIVCGTNSLTDLIQQPCGAQHRGESGFMGKFSTVFLCSMRAVELGYKPLSAFFSRQFRPQAPDMACGLVRSTLSYV